MSTRAVMTWFGLALLLGISPSYSTAFVQEAVVTVPTANIRSGPGTKHDIVARAKEGDRFRVIRVTNQWVQIELEKAAFEAIKADLTDKAAAEGREAWIYRRLIQFVGKPPDFEDRQIDFQDWALEEIPVTYIEFKSDWKICVQLPPDQYASKERVRQIALKMAQEYKKQTGYMEREVVVEVLRKDSIYATASF